MATPRHLSRAPIREAIFDFRVKPRDGLKPEELEAAKSRVEPQFSKVEKMVAGQVTFKVSPGATSAPEVQDLGLQGLLFKSADENLLAQFRLNGFTLNRLEPYTSWNELFPLAMSLWSTYCSIARPERVVRIALRYINQIKLPDGVLEFERYLCAAPEVPPNLPQSVAAFHSRTTIVHREIDSVALVAQSLQARPAGAGPVFTLDIDVSSAGTWSAQDPSIADRFDKLHSFKNDIFFSYVTDTLLASFE